MDRGKREGPRKTVSTEHPEKAASVNIGAISYRAHCSEAGCKNLGRLQMI
jgi:hypothetical protein